MMQVDSYEVTTVEAERFRLDGGAMFGVVPKPLWSRVHPADDRNRIQMVTRCLLVRGEGRVILVDTGMGAAWSDKERDIYAIENGERSIVEGLKRKGLSASDVTDVILTHLHFDHAGGAVTREGSGGAGPTFPGARYHLQREQFEWAQEPTQKDRRSFRSGDFLPLRQEGRLVLVDGESEIIPGIHVVPTWGHTIGHQVVRVGEGRGAVVYCGDLIPTAAHVPLPWVMSFDLEPLTTMREKQSLMEKAAGAEWVLVMEHDPAAPAVRVRREGESFTAEDLGITERRGLLED